MAARMRVIHHERKALAGHFSIERVFSEVRKHLPHRYEVKSCPVPEPSKGILPRWRNVRHAGQQKADVHHIVGDSHYLAFGLPPERTVLTIHDCAPLERLIGIRRAILKYFWFTGPMRRAAMVTTISEATKSELRKWVGALADKVQVIPDCVFDEFQYAPRVFNEELPCVLQVGTKWNKNLGRVMEALKETGCRLEVVGEQGAGSEERGAGSEGVEVQFLGRLSDAELVEAYRRCDMVVFASLYEGFGLPVLEGQAVGRPVITSNISALPEAAGDGALLVDPYSVEAIRAAVLRVKNEPRLREELIARGLKNVERFRPAAVAGMYGEVYEILAAKRA